MTWVGTSFEIKHPTPVACMEGVLRASPLVKEVFLEDVGSSFVKVILDNPEGINYRGEVPIAYFRNIRSSEGEMEIEISMSWIGQGPDSDYLDHFKNVIFEIRKEAINQCHDDL